jgi:hypothetical protein
MITAFINPPNSDSTKINVYFGVIVDSKLPSPKRKAINQKSKLTESVTLSQAKGLLRFFGFASE